ncbi:hypothetical protein BD413DRAFT_473522 [Trametes elegans]|nr:hypothetical protein BD413DRAFT_473522 [Trametes elegans]
MVSADNLNFDCLELIFTHLAGNDLVSVSLVSRSFLAAAIPQLYRTLVFGLNQSKRYPSIISPFAAVLAHSNLASHVRHIDLRAVPTTKSVHQPKFLDECARTVALCKNLGSFTCTLDIMPIFLPSLCDKESLEQTRFIANFTTDQSAQMLQMSGLRELTLDSGTWNVVDALPKWADSLRPTLTSLTFHSIQSLSLDILDTILPNLPNLTRLHVIGCPKVNHTAVLRAIAHTPNLESLAFTSYESSSPLPPVIAPLPRLRHLAVDTQAAPSPANTTPAFWTTVVDLTRTWSCPLKSLTLRLSDRVTLSDAFIANVVDVHHATLTHLALLNCSLSKDSVARICRACTELERFALSLPAKDAKAFSEAIARAKRIHTVTDVGDLHSSHNPRPPLSKLDIRLIMARQRTLERVVADGRVWTVRALSARALPAFCSLPAVRVDADVASRSWPSSSDRRCAALRPRRAHLGSAWRRRRSRRRITGSCRPRRSCRDDLRLSVHRRSQTTARRLRGYRRHAHESQRCIGLG